MQGLGEWAGCTGPGLLQRSAGEQLQPVTLAHACMGPCLVHLASSFHTCMAANPRKEVNNPDLLADQSILQMTVACMHAYQLFQPAASPEVSPDKVMDTYTSVQWGIERW